MNAPHANAVQAPSLSREQINLLPLRKYGGRIEVIAGGRELAASLPGIAAERELGFDIEVRPTFRKGDHFPPALVQLAGDGIVWIVQLQRIADLSPLSRVLSDPGIVKAGVAVAGDIAKLHEVMAFDPAGFVDLGGMALARGVKAGGVRTLAAHLLAIRISKGAQCSNWERADLSLSQVIYAATDAWICREIYLSLKNMPEIQKKTKK